MTTYQRLKKENANLKHALHTVCCAPDSEEAKIITMHYKLLSASENVMWMGNTSTICRNTKTFDGILTMPKP